MPRNSQGLYTLPPSNPVSPNTLIEAEWANATMEDIGEALTESLPRDGSAPMTGPLILRTGNPTQPREAVSKAYMEQFLAYATGMPVGAVFAFASGTTPPGYLLCNGQAVSRTTYATLFAAIGVVYGNGDGSTTFNVPDLRNEFVRGKTDARPLGNKQEASLASHIHPVVDPTHTHGASGAQNAHSHIVTTNPHNHTVTDRTHTHGGQVGTGTGSGAAGGSGITQGAISNAATGISVDTVGDIGGFTDTQTPTVFVSISAATTGVSTGATGGDETRPQNIALDYYIKAMSDTSGPVTLTGIETSDANMIAIDNTNPIVPLLDIQSNVAFGIPKLDSTGKIGLAQMPTSSAQFLGYFDASPGALPDTAGITSGDYYAVSVQGTLTVYDPVTLTAAPTLVVVGSQLHYVSGSVSNPTGWYTLTVASATLASDIQFIPGGTLNGTNVQTAISELDSETQTALGGKAPSAAATGAGTSFPPSGSIGASNVTAAIQELDTETVKLAGGTMAGNLTAPSVLVSAAQSTAANALTRKDYVDTPKSGQVIQTIFAKDAGSLAIGAGGSLVNTTLATKTISPKSTNSKIKVSVSTYLYGTSSQSAGGNFVNAQIYCSSGGAPQGDIVSIGNTNGNISQQIATNTIIEHVFDNTNLTPKSFDLFACNSLSGTSSDGAAALQVWTLTEVQN